MCNMPTGESGTAVNALEKVHHDRLWTVTLPNTNTSAGALSTKNLICYKHQQQTSSIYEHGRVPQKPYKRRAYCDLLWSYWHFKEKPES